MPERTKPVPNPCQRCGACCATYKVLFPSREVDDHEGGHVPHGLAVHYDAERSAMRGTTTFSKRCVALEGIIGQQVACVIYADRPSACHKFTASWEADSANETCDRARNRFGLPPLGDTLAYT